MTSPVNGSLNPLASLRQLATDALRKPIPELIHDSLDMVVQALDARAAFLARIEDESLEFVDVVCPSGRAPLKGQRMPLSQTMAAGQEDQVVSLHDASQRPGYQHTDMCRELGITSYLGVPVWAPAGGRYGTIGVLGKEPKTFNDAETDLLIVVAGLLGQRLFAVTQDSSRGSPLLALRLATEQVDQPLAIMRGYAEMLTRNEVPAEQMALVAKRLAMQSETVVRAVDEMMILARLPLQLAFTVRVSLPALLQAAVTRTRERASAAGIELRLQIDVSGEVWGDPDLLGAALDEMVNNVFKHAQGTTVLQLRLRQPGPDRFHVIVKDDGQGISADRLAELFSADESPGQPSRGEGLGLYLLRRVARAHGGSTWANSLEGKGTTFYLELPAASPDGQAARLATSMPAPA